MPVLGAVEQQLIELGYHPADLAAQLCAFAAVHALFTGGSIVRKHITEPLCGLLPVFGKRLFSALLRRLAGFCPFPQQQRLERRGGFEVQQPAVIVSDAVFRAGGFVLQGFQRGLVPLALGKGQCPDLGAQLGELLLLGIEHVDVFAVLRKAFLLNITADGAVQSVDKQRAV